MATGALEEAAAREYLECRRWPDGPRCPVCGMGERITARAGGFYRCNRCLEDFTVRTGTILERSHVPLHKWNMAYMFVMKGGCTSSLQLADKINITQKSAWFVLRRFQEACANLRRLGQDITYDGLLAYRPKPKSEPAKRREHKRKAAKANRTK
jgi:transposase-like protein